MQSLNGIDLILIAIIIFGAVGCWMSHRPYGFCDYCDGPIQVNRIDGRSGWYCSIGCCVCGDEMRSHGV